MYMNGPPEGGGDRKFRWPRMLQIFCNKQYLVLHFLKTLNLQQQNCSSGCYSPKLIATFTEHLKSTYT